MRRTAVQETGGLFDLSIVVVDNDSSGEAKEAIEKLKAESGLDIFYDFEPERAIPVVRNRALNLASGNYIAIIDDDEFPSPDWLVTMYRAIQTFEVDGALGPVHPFFTRKPPDWLIRGKFCERPSYRTGTLLNWNQTRTGNVLLRKEVFDEHTLRFDPRFKTGGSDQDFFRRAMALGYRFVAVEEAPVYEIVPQERWKASYYLKRALVNGFNAHKYGVNQARRISRFAVLLKTFGAIAAYAFATPFSAFLGRHILIGCLERGGHHFSRLLAIFGIELIKKRNF